MTDHLSITDADGDSIDAARASEGYGGPSDLIAVRVDAGPDYVPLAVFLTPEQVRELAEGLTALAEEVSA